MRAYTLRCLRTVACAAAMIICGSVLVGQQPAPGGQQSLDLSALPTYVPTTMVTGTIRNYGNNYIPALMKEWEDGFGKMQPGVTFETSLPGSEAAMAGLYGDIADLAFIGRESYPTEVHAFEEVKGYAPLGIEISSGSFMTPHKTFALMVFVNKENPLAKTNLPELMRIFGCGSNAITEWGQLGLTGAWEHRPIHVYGYAPTTGMARFFSSAVLGENGRWTASMHDFDNGHRPDGEVINAGVYVLRALAADPDGIAYANFLYTTPEVRALALASTSGSGIQYHEPTRDNVFSRLYPLTRFTTVFLDRKPGEPVKPALKEFLRYILSRDGMQAVVNDGAYVPLNAMQLEKERHKLD
ncbi:PstS family phosphate ABC transporter substrate-binding protein [Tunturibacter empetritectus]|uniref:Phosphate transport system substrate-binding protein n=1 Tax=Tunturiibacter lichenicola TaxID=2051959 RepID=A0A7W8J918_9BACT|nr:substrate-binding domain-containing protein [Edaphobacter lichenicola]MBB5343746.1 phosphate transport system substrate-binding protein [Edaphobacter lichenicola]